MYLYKCIYIHNLHLLAGMLCSRISAPMPVWPCGCRLKAALALRFSLCLLLVQKYQ